MSDGASTFNAVGPKCEGINCTHPSHDVTADPLCAQCGQPAESHAPDCLYMANRSWVVCQHSISIDATCERCTREGRELR